MRAAQELFDALRAEAEALHQRNLLAQTVGPDYFEPGMMEYLEQSDGGFDETDGTWFLRFEARGTRYEGRTEQIETMRPGDEIRLIREPDNSFNPNNFTLVTRRGRNVGNVPASICNALAPLYDSGALVFTGARASFVEPISKRSRHAKQAVLFVELRGKVQ